MEPTVSIVMPAFNSKRYIAQSIKSIINQTYGNWELLICDDGSTDSTYEHINLFSDSRIKVFRNELNIGYLKTANWLMQQCIGEFITFQDSDDISHCDRISSQIKAFQHDKELGICGTNGSRINSRGNHIGYITKPESHQEIIKTVGFRNPFIGSSIMINREVYMLVGGFREYFKDFAYQDYDWAWLVLERYKGINLPGNHYQYRQHSASNSKSVNLKRRLSIKLVMFLGAQRLRTGSDHVFEEKFADLERYLSIIEQPYMENRSMLYREYAADFIYARIYPKAIKMALTAVWRNPTSLIEYKLLLYCIKMMIFR